MMAHFASYGELKGRFDEAKKKAMCTTEASKVFEIRPSFSEYDAKVGRPSEHQEVISNHFKVDLSGVKPIHQYTITEAEDAKNATNQEDDDEEDKKPRSQRSDLIRRAIECCGHLRNHPDSYATDGLELAFAWKDLNMLEKNEPSTIDAPLAEFNVVSREAFARRPEERKKFQLLYHDTVPMHAVQNASSGDIERLPLKLDGITTASPAHAINVLVAKAAVGRAIATRNATGSPHTPLDMFQLGGNKFYDKTGVINFKLQGVKAYHGYFSALKTGMGAPLLNVNRTTTVFYEAGPVSDFMSTYTGRTIGNFTDDEKERLEGALRGVKVRIDYQHRVRAICGLGDRPAVESFMKLQSDRTTKSTTVEEHLRAENCKYACCFDAFAMLTVIRRSHDDTGDQVFHLSLRQRRKRYQTSVYTR